MAFYNKVDAEFGSEAKEDMKKYASVNRKLVLAKSRRCFLLKCRTTGIYPRHITKHFNGIRNKGRKESTPGQSQKIMKRFMYDLLSNEIKSTINNLQELQNNLGELRTRLKSNLPSAVVDSFLTSQNAFSEKFSKSQNEALNSKFQKLQTQEQKKRLPGGHKSSQGNSSHVPVPSQVDANLPSSSGPKLSPYNSRNDLSFVNSTTDVKMLDGYGGLTREDRGGRPNLRDVNFPAL